MTMEMIFQYIVRSSRYVGVALVLERRGATACTSCCNAATGLGQRTTDTAHVQVIWAEDVDCPGTAGMEEQVEMQA